MLNYDLIPHKNDAISHNSDLLPHNVVPHIDFVPYNNDLAPLVHQYTSAF